MSDYDSRVGDLLEAALVRDRWARGRCPCCGLDVGEGGEAIAEGVRICELCVMRGHHREEELIARLLTALVL